MNKDVAQFVYTLRKIPGIRVSTRGKHPKIYFEGQLVSTLPSTPSDHRWRLNTISELRQKGIDVKSFKEEKRAANGQSPPPLPVIERKEPSVPDALAPKNEQRKVLNEADEIILHLELLYDLKPRKGRMTGHGVVPRLQRILVEFATAEGRPVPHRDYKINYDTSDIEQMARLAANRVGDVAAHNRGSSTGIVAITRKTAEIVAFAKEAWDWFEARGYEFPQAVPDAADAIITPVSAPEVRWLPPRPADMPPVEAPVAAAVAINGRVSGDSIDMLLAAVALMGQANTTEAARIGRQLYEALGR